VPPRSRRPDVPQRLERLTLDLLAKEAGERPPSASAVVTLLRGFDSGGHQLPPRPVQFAGEAPPTATDASYDPAARPEEPPETVIPFGPQRGRRKGLLVALVAGVAVLAGGAFVLLNESGGKKHTLAATRKGVPSVMPGMQSNPNPVVPGWQVMLAPKYGVAYDVPPGWKLEKPDTLSTEALG
jgi:hypothetical protein